MKRLLLVFLLSGCAAQQPNQMQLAVISYYADMCQKQGVSKEALSGCVWAMYQRDVNAGVYGGGYNALQGMGQTLIQGTGYPSQTCTSRPDYMGGVVTTCR